MKKYIIYSFLFLFSISITVAESLPSNYTLINSDYELVGNGKYNNFDVRDGKYDSDPLVILKKLNEILDSHFSYVNSDAVIVTFNIYNGSQDTDTWNLYVEDLKFRTADYVLNNDSPGYVDLGTDSSIDICTWNIEHYPKDSQSEDKVKGIILDSKIDVFALQEIADDAGQFSSLLQKLGDGYEGYIYNPKVDSDSKWDQNIAFIYKKDEISIVTPAHEISEFKSEKSAFPRTPIEIVLQYKSGLEFVIINIHLKCCDGSEARRQDASEQLKKYIDDNYTASNTKVILLGDMNDRIDSKETNNVFSNFIDDANYVFTDTKVSEESTNGSGWANIDHILINKPLFEANDKDASKLDATDFDFNYDTHVSDHFPVWVNLNPELLSNDVNYIYKSKLNIYPNPSSNNSINIELPDNVKYGTLSIIDSSGKVMLSIEINTETVDVSSLSKGNYIVTLKSNNSLFTGKFVKK